MGAADPDRDASTFESVLHDLLLKLVLFLPDLATCGFKAISGGMAGFINGSPADGSALHARVPYGFPAAGSKDVGVGTSSKVVGGRPTCRICSGAGAEEIAFTARTFEKGGREKQLSPCRVEHVAELPMGAPLRPPAAIMIGLRVQMYMLFP